MPVAGLGVLTCDVPPGLVDEAVEAAGCRDKRRRLLPARTVVYLVLGLCLLSGADSLGPPGYRAVMRALAGGPRVPTASGLCRARQRLGAKPFQLLFERLARPLAAPGEAGSFALGLRTVAWDGTTAAVPATPANAALGSTGGGRDPQLRLLALLECGTRAVIGAALDGAGRASEQALARQVLACLKTGMLLLADRNFEGHELWGLARSTGAHLAWRARSSLVFEALEQLPDGSFTSVILTPRDAAAGWARRRRGLPPPPGGHPVRVIEYAVTAARRDGTARTQTFRLVTSLLDHQQAPAAALAALYHQRWEAENGFAELKTRLRGAGNVLRSRTPELACQELWAFLIVWHALARLRRAAALAAGTDPDRASFTVTVRTARDRARCAHSPAARASAIALIAADLLPPRRRDRQYPREKKRTISPYPARKTPPPGNVTYTIHITSQPPPAQSP